MTDAVIVSAVRTAVGKFGSSLAKTATPELGVAVIREALVRAKVTPDRMSEAIIGQVPTTGSGQNSARRAVIKAGLPNIMPSLAVNKVCGSGLKTVMLTVDAIIASDAEIVVAGGQENMSAASHILPGSRDGFHMSNAKLIDSMIVDELRDVYDQYHVSITAENVAKKYGIIREAQDEFAMALQSKAEAAQKSGRFNDEIVPILIPQRKGDPIAFAQDEFACHGATLESMTGLKPAFDKVGTVTAINASGLNDGAATVVVMSATRTKGLGLTPLVATRAYASTGLDPRVMNMGPVPTSKRCLSHAGQSVGDLDLVEISEVFTAQALAVHQQMGWGTSKTNVNGGAIAIGCPIGASGCRILVTLLYEIQKRDVKRGLASLRIGGSMDVALAVEHP